MGESYVRPISRSFFQERDMGHHDMITRCCQIIEGKLLTVKATGLHSTFAEKEKQPRS